MSDTFPMDKLFAMQKTQMDAFDVLHMAYNALRSYQYGNGSPELAEDAANAVETFLKGNKYEWGKATPVVEILAADKYQHEVA
jgi:hypothetical protein